MIEILTAVIFITRTDKCPIHLKLTDLWFADYMLTTKSRDFELTVLFKCDWFSNKLQIIHRLPIERNI